MTTRRSILSASVIVVGSVGLAGSSRSVGAEATRPLPVAASPAGEQAGSRPGPGADSLLGVFEGRTPCGAVATEFTGFPAQNCEKIKWRLTLYRHPSTGSPTTYAFKGTRATRQGRWRIERGRGSRSGWLVYHLDYEAPAKVLSLLAIDDRVLLLLDRDLNILVGDASWSYALNRTSPAAR